MAKLLNFTGFETQGGEEASSISGTPSYPTTSPRSGVANLLLDTAADAYGLPWVSTGITDSGPDNIIGFGIKYGSTTEDATAHVEVKDSAGATIISITMGASSKLEVRDQPGNVVITATNAVGTSGYHFVELNFLKGSNGNAEFYIDGVDEGTVISTDFDAGGSLNSSAELVFTHDGSNQIEVDDVYILSAGTPTSQLGNFAVKAYQNTAEDATDQGDALADGTWALVSETPGNEDAANDAQYQDTGNLAGSTICDEGTRSGPSGDGDVTGTIKGAKWIGNFKRSSGGGRTHEFWVGNDADWITTPTTKTVVTLSLGVTYAITEKLLEASDLSVPTTSDFFQHGFSKSATAGQDIFCGDIWAMLGYVPGGGDTTMVAAQGSYTLTGKAATTTKDTPVVAAQGSYALTGKDAITSRTKSIPADQGAYALTGKNANTLWGHAFAAAQGSYALTGQAAITVKDTPITAAQGSYNLSGQAAILLWNHLVAATQGSYTLTGKDAATRQGSTLAAVQGAYALSGQASNLLWDHLIAAAQGSYALTGQAAITTKDTPMTAVQGAYALNGQAAILLRNHLVAAVQGSYALTGQAAVLSRQITITGVQGNYTLTGQDALTFEERLLAAQMLPLLGVG